MSYLKGTTMKKLKAFKLLSSPAAFALLVGCNSQHQKEEIEITDETEITEFCNVIAAEMVANPNSNEPWARLQKKHLEEEWSNEDVDRICSEAVRRKRDLIYGDE